MIQRFLKRLARRILRNELTTLKNTVRCQEKELNLAHNRIHSLSNREIQVERHYGISREVFTKRVLSVLPNTVVNSTVTPTQASYLLGVQHACRVFEAEVVHD